MRRHAHYGRGGRRSGIGTAIAVMLTMVAALTAIAMIVLLINLRRTDTTPAPRSASDAYCTAGNDTMPLNPTQAANAALITRIAIDRGLPDHAATVALATAMQESKLTNITYGDLDSVGLFQQRPSQGWGSVDQLTDETYAANAFYDALVKVPDWQTIPTEDAAQEVQRSGYPDLYANWDGLARAWAQALTGEVPAGATCALEPASTSDHNGLVAALGETFPTISVTTGTASATADGSTANGTASSSSSASASASSSASAAEGSSKTLTLTVPAGLSDAGATRLTWQAATWLVTQARAYGIDAVRANGMSWNRTDGVWTGSESGQSALSVTLV
ncbi:cobalt transporter [Bifidobacterium callimiconis]|uniref:Cobalt transporter n=1 Tax=Bifidobacterium callimiconis TaxID=2306973 RepID=A0A430FHQ0_9BIFI|nr:cobalt transporter [Bifidobacterium callimiconis]MBT1176491.1 cobalt transporter [Bifidobacterium callimiconis]RSX52376.1 cobalt transporter [Bifidobacterium callimiconis]